jgi:xanthine dehydrogenase YagR molybdenum-binding subunit
MANIGQAIDRVDGRLKVSGRARYAAEFRGPELVHAMLVQSTIGAGAIAGFDLNAAQAMPGVLAIITPDNALRLATGGGSPQTVRAPPLQERTIHYNGPLVSG